MPFSLGLLELLRIALIAAPTLVLYVFGDARCRWAFAALVCAVLAAVLTPADIVSAAVLFVAFLGIFMMGVRYHAQRLPASH